MEGKPCKAANLERKHCIAVEPMQRLLAKKPIDDTMYQTNDQVDEKWWREKRDKKYRRFMRPIITIKFSKPGPPI